MPKQMYHIQSWKQGLIKQQCYQIKGKLNCYLILRKDSWKPCPVNEQVLSYIMLPNVHILIRTTNYGGYLGCTVGGAYVAKPRMSLQLYNSKNRGFPNNFYKSINFVLTDESTPGLAWWGTTRLYLSTITRSILTRQLLSFQGWIR